MKSRTRTSTSAPPSAVPTKVGAHPAECSSRASSTVLMRLPATPNSAAPWAIIGPRRAGNQREPSRSTLTKVMASPHPSTAREASAMPYEWESAKPSWPRVNRTIPMVSTRLVPSRSTIRPTGICMPA